jgi:hypothetical protein
MRALSAKGHRNGGGPVYQVEVNEMAPPRQPSAAVIVLCDIEMPKPTVGGGECVVGPADNEAQMPDELQSFVQSYSPSITLSLISRKST